eukprot:996696-Pyramimonas_sp.AAC.1
MTTDFGGNVTLSIAKPSNPPTNQGTLKASIVFLGMGLHCATSLTGPAGPTGPTGVACLSGPTGPTSPASPA